jgi:hypothetical protein
LKVLPGITTPKNLANMVTLLKGDDVAKILNIRCSHLCGLMHRREAATIQMGRSCRVKVQNLTAYIGRNLHRLVDPGSSGQWCHAPGSYLGINQPWRLRVPHFILAE